MTKPSDLSTQSAGRPSDLGYTTIAAPRSASVMPLQIELLVTDLDNTLYDWVGFFAKAFRAMVDEAVVLLNVDREQLLDDLQAVHQRYHDSERAWSLAETHAAHERWPGTTLDQRKEKLNDAFHAFNRVRKQHLQLYPGVEGTLAAIARRGVPIVAHTEASAINALNRIQRLNLGGLLTRVYAKECGRIVESADTTIVPVPREIHKPDPRILYEVCREFGVSPESALYVGDSLSRDVGMARQIGMHAAWAAYGTRHAPEDWSTLVRVTHWTREDVERVKQTEAQLGHSTPDVVLEQFAELLEHFDFQPRRQLVKYA